jgi:starvation-inducible DNA-binding protein
MKTNTVRNTFPAGPETEIQAFGTVVNRPLALNHKVRLTSVNNLNQILADTITLRDLYKKHHWQVSGPLFYQLHLLFDKHFNEQVELVDAVAERIQTLGGVSLAMPADVAEVSRIPAPPKGREEAKVQVFRLLQAHEWVIEETREAARLAAVEGDDGTNELLIGQVLRVNEFQAWFLSEQVEGSGFTNREIEFGRPFDRLAESDRIPATIGSGTKEDCASVS